MDGLATPHPLGATLPGIYQEDAFVQRLCGALDDVLAPVVATLDSLPAYLDPATTPADLLGWLAGWVGLVTDGPQSPRRQRELVRTGVELNRWRGTSRGVRDAVALWFGIAPEVVESGGASWSTAAGGALPGEPTPFLLVRLPVADLSTVDLRQLDAVVAAVKPAHIPHRVELVAAGQ